MKRKKKISEAARAARFAGERGAKGRGKAGEEEAGPAGGAAARWISLVLLLEQGGSAPFLLARSSPASRRAVSRVEPRDPGTCLVHRTRRPARPMHQCAWFPQSTGSGPHRARSRPRCARCARCGRRGRRGFFATISGKFTADAVTFGILPKTGRPGTRRRDSGYCAVTQLPRRCTAGRAQVDEAILLLV
ncbi:MAG: hypothetical protein BJ554DRAFT_1415 [Olpidium bornovanus]|uniref:Uncharacterized protein n=1 Tax=Olpidium bornovanus TaxID=278681 RepID=A0A8H7ZS46_9FUNG|nr:MAG: hypothetical protein BJ554DRAFT_1415 [Olpidium bornovanus]